MKGFVTGANGQLGFDVLREMRRRGFPCAGSDIGPAAVWPQDPSAPYVPLDITEEGSVQRAVEAQRPDVIFHCAAWTAVDAAEDDQNRPRADAVNRLGTAHVARAAKAVGAKMIYLSTDYVFSDQTDRPLRPEDPCGEALNVYGRTKRAGELAVSSLLTRFFIVRTSWVFGLNGRNFIETMIRAGRTRPSVRVVCDQIGRPTYTRDLARLLLDMAESERFGVYHATNEGRYVSWYELCRECYRQAGLSTSVIPVSTEEYGLSRARRPLNSRLDNSALVRAGFEPLPSWEDAVGRYLKEAGWR